MNSRKPRGLFLNSKRAQCSIYQSGRMAFDSMRLSQAYHLDYREIDATDHHLAEPYDFYVFNYHHVTMAWLDTRAIRRMPGLKFTLVLEVAPGDPFVLCPREDFDAYLPLDPSLSTAIPRVFPMPRPLPRVPSLPPFREPEIPVIGTFGFATPGKGFEAVVDAVGREFDRAVVRLNVPHATYADDSTTVLHGRPYADYLEDLCRRVARPGITVDFQRRFLSDEDLIAWCAENTLNCFLYTRDQPGLSATTDQAIVAGRPLAINTNPTFRHLHPYLTPYPYRSLRESIAESLPGVLAMQEDWTSLNFARRFEDVLAQHGLLPARPAEIHLRTLPEPTRIPILLVNHAQEQCGIHQYGVDIAEALQTSRRYAVHLVTCSSQAELETATASVQPAAVIYNHYPLTMPWLSPEYTRRQPIPQIGVMHEVTQAEADQADTRLFDFHLCPDPTLEARNPICLKIPRLVPTYCNMHPLPSIPTIGTFGFAFSDKGFQRIVAQVNAEFDEAIVLIHAPKNDIVESDSNLIIEACRAMVTKPGIQVRVNQKFFTKARLLDFLASNSLNVFLYDEHKDRGISSSVEKAMAVHRPVAVSRSGMFRHLHGATPSVVLGERSLREIMETGIAPLVPYLQEWNAAAFVKGFEEALDQAVKDTASILASREAEEAPKGADSRLRRHVQTTRILWCLGPSASELLLATPILPALRAAMPGAQLTAVVPRSLQGLLLHCPHLQDLLTYDERRLERDASYRSALETRLREIGPDFAWATSTSTPLPAQLAQASGAPIVAGHAGACTHAVPPLSPLEPEGDRHQRLLASLGIEMPGTHPLTWITPEEEARMEDLLRSQGLDPSCVLAFCPEGDPPVNAWADALTAFCEAQGLTPVVLGGTSAVDLADSLIALWGRGLNLCGCLDVLETAAMVKICPLAAGNEGAWVHMACAVRTPHALALGGSQFGRFAPYSTETVAAVLPLTCYGCEGDCPHPTPLCLTQLTSATLLHALEIAWHRRAYRPRLVIQGQAGQDPSQPYLDLSPLLDPAQVQWQEADPQRAPVPLPRPPAGPLQSLAILMPSRGRLEALREMLAGLRISPRMKYIITAHYEDAELDALRRDFGHKAWFIDQRGYGDGGMTRTFNLAHFKARELGFDYAMLLCDDMLPQEPQWHTHLEAMLAVHDVDFGVLSTDETHKGVFGWNFFAGYPCGHLCLGRIDALGDFFLNPSFFSYVADNEVCIRMSRQGTRIHLLPLRVDHNHQNDPTRVRNAKFYEIDLNIFNAMFPDLRGRLDDVVMKGAYRQEGRFVLDQGRVVTPEETPGLLVTYDELLAFQEKQ